MQVIQEFYTKLGEIQFIMADDKENMYYLPSVELNRFDLLKVVYSGDEEEIKIYDDILQLALLPFLTGLKESCNNKLNLDIIIAHGMGRACNEALFYGATSNDINYLWRSLVWEFKHISTYVYQLNKRCYLEIAPNYPWHFSEPQENELFISFEVYIESYKPYAVIELDQATVCEWIEQCEGLIDKMT